MLVCAFFAQFGTRDRGCSVHPAFPAPSPWRGRQRICITRAKSRRGNEYARLLPRRPCESRDPYAAAEIVRARWSTALLQQQPTVAMGPCFRRDDDGSYNASPFSNRGTSPDNPAAWRMNRLFSGGARSTKPRPISRTVRSNFDSLENNRFSELVATPIAMVSKRRQRW